MGYADDTLFHLAPVQSVIVVLIALLLGGAVIWGVAYVARRVRRWLALAFAGCAFVVYLWLSPQAFYLYYVQIFDDLPWQIVVRCPPPNPVPYLTFTAPPSLSSHGQGLLGWALIVVSLLQRRSVSD